MDDRLTPEREAEIRLVCNRGSIGHDLLRELDAVRAELASKNRLLPSLIAEGTAIERGRAEVAEARASQLDAALTWVLPMAKGYAAAHPVGNNAGIVADAEAARAASPALTNEQMREKEAAAYVRRQQKVGPIPADPLLRQGYGGQAARCTCGVAAISDAPVEPMPHALGCPGGGSES